MEEKVKQGSNADELRRICSEAYQVVGSLLSDLGKFDRPEAEKILDNLSQQRMVHDDVLPWPSYELQTTAEEVRQAILEERERCARLCDERAATWGGDPPEDKNIVWTCREEEARNCAAAIRDGK